MAKRRKTTPKKRVLRAVDNIDDKAGRLAALILVKKNAENEKKLAIAESEKKLAESEKTLAIAEKKLAIAEIEKSRIHERLLQCAGLLTARGIVERFAQLAYHEQLKARHIKGNFVCTHALVEAVKNPDAGPWSTFLSTSMQECVEKKGLDAPCEVAKVWKDLSEAVHGCPWYGPDVLLISSLNDIGKCLVRKLAAHFGLNVVEKAPECVTKGVRACIKNRVDRLDSVRPICLDIGKAYSNYIQHFFLGFDLIPQRKKLPSGSI